MTPAVMTGHRDPNERSNTLFAVTLATGSLMIGALLIVGTSGPTNQVMLQIAQLWQWGAAFIAAGAVALVGQGLRHAWLIRVGHGVATILATMVAGCFWVAATGRDLHASLHGFGWALTVAVMHFLVALISRPPK